MILRSWRPRSPGTGDQLALEDLYRELAAHRAHAARTALAGEPDRSRRFAQSAAVLEAVAARFELAADITRARRAR